MRKLLIITYYWPPGSGPGVQRYLKFCKYFYDFGWEPTVITISNGSYPAIDRSLLKDVPNQLKVIRTGSLEPFALYNWLRGGRRPTGVGFIGVASPTSFFGRLSLFIRANFFIPDARIGWNRFAYKAAKRAIASTSFDAVITTGPPHSTHLIGEKIKAAFGIPHFVDLRDPWTDIYYNHIFPRTARTIKKDTSLERRICSQSDGLIAISPGLNSEFQKYNKNTKIVFNGYDEEDFGCLMEPSPENRFVLAYVGNLKSNQNVPALWNALKELLEEDHRLSKHLAVRLTGNVDSSILDGIKENDLNQFLSVDAFLDHHEAIDRMVSAAMLLFIIPDVANKQLILTGKLFEYLASATPLLCVGPKDGDASKILRDTERGEMIEYDEKDRIKAEIHRAFKSWMTGTQKVHSIPEKVKDYSRSSQTAKLVSFIEETLDDAK